MELDDFKASWNASQEKDINKQKLSTDKLEQLMKNSGDALQQIQKTNDYWYKTGTTVCTVLIGILLVELILSLLVLGAKKSFGQSTWPVLVMVVFAFVSIWFYKRQQQIFDVKLDTNIKEALSKTLTDFKRFYILYMATYLVLFPLYFYALITLVAGTVFKPGNTALHVDYVSRWLTLSNTGMAEVCIGTSVVFLLLSHWYYRIKYFKYINILQTNLKELEA
jgi:hypothetical protein